MIFLTDKRNPAHTTGKVGAMIIAVADAVAEAHVVTEAHAQAQAHALVQGILLSRTDLFKRESAKIDEFFKGTETFGHTSD